MPAKKTTKTATITRRRQPAIRGGREALPSCVERHIWAEVDRAARRFRCSRSWVVAVALADAMGIDLEPKERYDAPTVVARKKKEAA